MGIPLYSPSNYEELRYWLHVLTAPSFQGPRAIRYPRGGESERLAHYGCSKQEFDQVYHAAGANAAIISYASEVEDALQAAELLQEKQAACDVYKLVKLYPFTEELLDELQRYSVVLCAEECVPCGSIGEHLLFALHERGWAGKFVSCAVQSNELPHASVPEMKRVLGLDAAHLVQKLEQALNA
jgi:1-deoxy-D-xylulose-5-phosphate synthase